MKAALSLLIILSMLTSSCQREEYPTLAEEVSILLKVEHEVSNQPFVLGNEYTNPHGENFTVTKFKYYISKIQLHHTVSGAIAPVDETYFLVDEANANSKSMSFTSRSGTYDQVSFLIGVDSLRNVSGAQTGALDPANDMFWTWNSGYIMAKMEGHSPQSSLVNNEFEYHIGGFKGTNNVVQRVYIPLNGDIEISSENNLSIVLAADINKWFNNVHVLRIADHPAAVMPGTLANQFADNYRGMFTLRQLENN